MDFLKSYYTAQKKPLNKMVIIGKELKFLPDLIDNYSSQNRKPKTTFLCDKGTIHAPKTSIDFGQNSQLNRGDNTEPAETEESISNEMPASSPGFASQVFPSFFLNGNNLETVQQVSQYSAASKVGPLQTPSQSAKIQKTEDGITVRVVLNTPIQHQKRGKAIEFNRLPSPNLTEENDPCSGRRFTLKPIVKQKSEFSNDTIQNSTLPEDPSQLTDIIVKFAQQHKNEIVAEASKKLYEAYLSVKSQVTMDSKSLIINLDNNDESLPEGEIENKEIQLLGSPYEQTHGEEPQIKVCGIKKQTEDSESELALPTDQEMETDRNGIIDSFIEQIAKQQQEIQMLKKQNEKAEKSKETIINDMMQLREQKKRMQKMWNIKNEFRFSKDNKTDNSVFKSYTSQYKNQQITDINLCKIKTPPRSQITNKCYQTAQRTKNPLIDLGQKTFRKGDEEFHSSDEADNKQYPKEQHLRSVSQISQQNLQQIIKANVDQGQFIQETRNNKNDDEKHISSRTQPCQEIYNDIKNVQKSKIGTQRNQNLLHLNMTESGEDYTQRRFI